MLLTLQTLSNDRQGTAAQPFGTWSASRSVFMKATFLFALATFLAQATFAQARIEGQVNDESGGALAACRVVLLNAQRKPLLETQTNAIGRYVVQPVAPGKYYLQVVAPGFEPAVAEVTLRKEPVTRVAFVLRIAKTEFQVDVGSKSYRSLDSTGRKCQRTHFDIGKSRRAAFTRPGLSRHGERALRFHGHSQPGCGWHRARQRGLASVGHR